MNFLALYDSEFAQMSIDRAHRSIRKTDPGKLKSLRPVFPEFVSWQDASRVLSMAAKTGKYLTSLKIMNITFQLKCL